MLMRWLEERRAEERLTQAEMAATLGITPGAYSLLLNRRTRIGFTTMQAILRKYPHDHLALAQMMADDPRELAS